MSTACRYAIGLGVAAGGLLGAALIPLATVPIAQASPFFPEPPCIVTGTGLCVPDTVWPIPAGGGGLLHPPPFGHYPAPPPSSPPEVISCIIDEGCFTRPGVAAPGDELGGADLGGGVPDVYTFGDLPAL